MAAMRGTSLLAAILLAGAGIAPAEDIAGDWHGSVEVSNDAPLRLALHIGRDNKANLDSMDEGGMAIPVDSVTVNGSTMKFEMKSIGGSYEGKIAAGGTRITGAWTQDGGVWPLIWQRGEDPAGITRPIGEQEAIRKGRTYTQWFYEGSLANLWPKLAPVMQQALVSEAGLSQLRDRMLRQMGSESKLTAESVKPAGALQIYRRRATFDKSEEEVEVEFAFDPRGAAAGFNIQLGPHEATPHKE
jgi:hypothetical protein